MTADYSRIPESTMESLKAWIETGRPLGSFCHALVENDLREAFRRADDANIAAMFDTVCWLYNHAPMACWGSPEAAANWVAKWAS